MTQIPRLRPMLTTSEPSHPQRHRQLSLTFESRALQGLTPSERSNVIVYLATVLLQAAGVQAKEVDDEQL